ncbi:MAG: hypothetical protein MJE66_03470 [Proteobacteria bacterium]|nr:hypothetical protein [Pseudomonadota bacterium]
MASRLVVVCTAVGLVAAAASLGALGCASSGGTEAAPAQQADASPSRTRRVLRAMKDGITSVPVPSVRYEEPTSTDYGRYPRNYAKLVKRHLIRFMSFPEDAEYRFEKPQKGYMSKGLIQGGGVAWQGYLVDIEIVKHMWLDQTESKRLVARVRDGEIVDVHSDPEDPLLHRLSPPSKKKRKRR